MAGRLSRLTGSSKVRALSGAADQVFSSLSNGLIIYAVAVVTEIDYFGRLALLLTLLAAAIGVLRGALGTPLLLTAGGDPDDIRREGSYALTSALLVSPVVAAVMVGVAGPALHWPDLLIIAATPIVLAEDVLRYVAIALGRPQVAALWDGIWFVGSAALLLATWLHVPVAGTAGLLAGWTALGFCALVGLVVGVRVRPRFRHYRQWLLGDWQHRARYAMDSGLEQSVVFVILLFATVVLNPQVSATLRGATALMAPLAIVASAIPLAVIPESKRQNMPSPRVWRALSRIALVSMVGTLVVGAALFFLPGNIGELVLGDTFDSAQAVVPIIALEYAIGAWVIAVTIFLRNFNRSADALKLKVGYTLVVLVTALGGAVLFHTAAGVAAGIATATTFVAAMALLRFRPWAPPPDPEDLEDAESEKSDSRTAATVATYNFLKVGRARPLPSSTKLRLQETTEMNGALIALWTFVTMGFLVPVGIIRFTGVPSNATWLWSLPGIVLCAARFGWLIGNGERRLFEVMFWGYSYAFLGLAPLVQLRQNEWPVTVQRMDSGYTGAGELIVLIGCGAFLAGAGLDNVTTMRQRWQRAKRPDGVVGRTFTISHSRTVWFCGFAILLNIYYLSKVGWIQFLKSRDEAFATFDAIFQPGSVGMMVRSSSYMALLVAFIALMRFRKEAKKALAERLEGWETIPANALTTNMTLLVIIGILLANSMNPISNARYLSGTAILAAATAFGLFSTKLRFRLSSTGYLVGLLLIFPLADAFRTSTEAQLKATNPVQALMSADYDSFAQVMNGYMVGAREGIVPLKQFVGVVLFWVPRSAWPDKPVDTGIYIANVRGYPMTNLSAPLWIEFYMNGGWVPLVLCMFALGYGLHHWDTRLNTQFDIYRMPALIGCILPFYMMILLRGSLLQAANYLFFILVFAFVVREPRNTKPPPVARPAPAIAPEESGAEPKGVNYVRA